MVYVVASGSKQYVVGVGQKIKVEKLASKAGDIIDLDDLLNGKKVKAKVLATAKSVKVSTLKFKPKTKYMRRLGHRQFFTTLEIIGTSSEKRRTAVPKKDIAFGRAPAAAAEKKKNVPAKKS